MKPCNDINAGRDLIKAATSVVFDRKGFDEAIRRACNATDYYAVVMGVIVELSLAMVKYKKP